MVFFRPGLVLVWGKERSIRGADVAFHTLHARFIKIHGLAWGGIGVLRCFLWTVKSRYSRFYFFHLDPFVNLA